MVTNTTAKQILEASFNGLAPEKQQMAALVVLSALSRQPIAIQGNPANGYYEVEERLKQLIRLLPVKKTATKEQPHNEKVHVVAHDPHAAIKVICEPTKNEEDWLKMITQQPAGKKAAPKAVSVALSDVIQTQEAIKKVKVGADAVRILLSVKRTLNLIYMVEFSDADWLSAVYVLMASAYYNNRKEVEAADCLLLQYLNIPFSSAQNFSQYCMHVQGTCFNTDKAIDVFSFSEELKHMERLKTLKGYIDSANAQSVITPPQPQTITSIPNAPPTDLRMIFVPVVGGHYFVEGLELLVRENDLKQVGTVEFTEIKLYQLQKTGEFTDAGSFMVRMYGNCRLEFKTKPIRTKDSSVLKIRTFEGVPVLDPDGRPDYSETSALPVATQQQQSVLPPQITDTSAQRVELANLKTTLYVSLSNKRQLLAGMVIPTRPVKNIFLPGFDFMAAQNERLQAAHNTIKKIEEDLAAI